MAYSSLCMCMWKKCSLPMQHKNSSSSSKWNVFLVDLFCCCFASQWEVIFWVHGKLRWRIVKWLHLGDGWSVPFPHYKFTLKYASFLGMFFHKEGCISPTLVNIYNENNNKMYCLEMNISIPHTQFVPCVLVQPQSKWS